MRAFERAIRRASLPVAHTQGFNPRPRLVFAAPLGVGGTGDNERLCVALERPVPAEAVLASLRTALPPGLSPAAAHSLPGVKAPAYHLIPWAEWEVALPLPAPSGAELARLCADLLTRNEVRVQRRRKAAAREVDIRPGILALSDAGYARLRMTLSLIADRSAKPLEVVEALGLPRGDERVPHPLVHRLQLAPTPG
jgi:radical SAM-linked protein